MSGVAIRVIETGLETWSAVDGTFYIPNLCPGTYHISFVHVRCPEELRSLNLVESTELVINMEHHHNMLHQVDVHDSHEDGVNSERLTSVDLLQSTNKTLAASITEVAGISLISNGSDIGLPVLHGMFGNRLTLINNGVAHTGQQWGADHAPEIDPNVAQNIKIITGAAGLRYPGTHMGGVIVLEPGSIPSDPHIHGKIKNVLESNGRGGTTHASVYQGGEKTKWRLGSTLRWIGDRHTPDYYLRNTGSRQAHLNAQLQHEWNPRQQLELYYNYYSAIFGVLRGSHIGNLTDLELSLTREEPFFTEPDFTYRIEAPKQEVQHHLYKASYRQFWENWQLDMVLAGQSNLRDEFDIRRGNRSDRPALSLVQHSQFFETLFTYREHWTMGYQFQGKRNTNQPGTGVTPLLPNYTSYTNGAFVTYQEQLGKALIEAALRYDYTFRYIATLSRTIPRVPLYFNDTYSNLSALGRITAPLGSKWKGFLEVGLKQRPPEINEKYSYGLHQGVSGIEEGNLDLKTESAIKSTIQLRGVLTENVHLDARFYAHAFDGYIYLQPQQQYRLTIRGAFPVFTYEQCNALLLGSDATLRWALTDNLQWTSRWSYLRGTNLTDDLPLTYMPPWNAHNEWTYTVAKWRSLRNVQFSFEHKFTAEQTYWDESLDFVDPPESYHLFNARISGSFSELKSRSQVYVSVENLLNTTYRDYLNRQRYFADAVGRNITLGVTWNF